MAGRHPHALPVKPACFTCTHGGRPACPDGSSRNDALPRARPRTTLHTAFPGFRRGLLPTLGGVCASAREPEVAAARVGTGTPSRGALYPFLPAKQNPVRRKTGPWAS